MGQNGFIYSRIDRAFVRTNRLSGVFRQQVDLDPYTELRPTRTNLNWTKLIVALHLRVSIHQVENYQHISLGIDQSYT
jgi:hypothetical protein